MRWRTAQAAHADGLFAGLADVLLGMVGVPELARHPEVLSLQTSIGEALGNALADLRMVDSNWIRQSRSQRRAVRTQNNTIQTSTSLP